MSTTARTRILDANQIERKIQRIARQLIEHHIAEKEVVIIGIEGQGMVVASRLAGILKTVWDAHIVQGSIALDKNDPLAHPITCTLKSADLAGRPIVLVDDVLNSGRTLIYAVNHLLNAGPASISAAVLIDRIHRSFPVRADFCGLSLSTSVKSHIAVDLQANKNAAYLVG